MTQEEQKAVEEFTEMNLTKKGLYHYNDMQDAFLIGLFKGEKMQPSLPSNLDVAADAYIRRVADAAGHPGWDWETQDIAEAFKAGAKWQKEQDQPITGNSLEQEWLRYVDREKKEYGGELPSLGEYGWLQIARHFAEWGAEHLKR